MKNTTVGFIGGGRIVRVILQGWKRKGVLPAKIVVSDCNAENLNKLKTVCPEVVTTGDNALAAAQEIVFLSVHPPVMAGVVAGIKNSLSSTAVLVSLAPKFTLAKLTALCDGFFRLARIIPNAPSTVNCGFNPMVFGAALGESERALVRGLFEPLGNCPEVEESKLEGYALLSAMGPTYFWFQFQVLRDVARDFGLGNAETAAALKQMVSGALETLLESGLSPAEVMDLVPVKPLAEMEGSVTNLYKTQLSVVYSKIKP